MPTILSRLGGDLARQIGDARLFQNCILSGFFAQSY